MYDVLFSRQWILDVCMSALPNWIIFLLPLIVVFSIALLLRKKLKFSKLILILVPTTLLICIYPFYFFAFLIAGFSTCRPNMFFDGIDAAHPINAIIKERYKDNNNMPQNLDDIKKINPGKFEEITNNAKLNYVYDANKNTYVLFVRPSRYLVAIFDNRNDFKIYSLDKHSDQRFNPERNFYPPNYPGPWDQLPK